MSKEPLPSIRPLIAADLNRVVDIDASIGGRRRASFFEKRLEAALDEPGYFIYIGCDLGGALQGFLQARLLEGEYGSSEKIAVLDNVGVEPSYQGQGIGKKMMQEFAAILEHKNVVEIQTQADWRNTDLLQFLSAAGFQLAPRQVLEREVDYLETQNLVDPDSTFETESGEKDFSDPNGDQPGALAIDSVVCRSLMESDLPQLIRIDHKVTGHKHPAYYERKAKEVLSESGIRVSMVAEVKGQVVGFIMARVDYGEFDRTEPTAVLDSIAVNPGFAHQQVGSALLSQLLGNLTGLRLETIRTEVDSDHFDVLNFLMTNGFRASQELAFSYRIH